MASRAILSCLVLATAKELTKETWDEAASGKTVFVKFFAPWCGHCKKMKPDWDKLMMEYEGSSNVLIADVDCVGSGKSKCEEVGVRGYPTIKYGDPDDLQDYKGGRSFNDLSTFAKGLGPSCGPSTPELCDAAKKKMLDEFMAMDSAKREAMIKENSGEDEMEKLESGFKTFVEGLQKQYQESSDKKDADVEAIKSSGLGLLKAVQNYAKKQKDDL
ncbi:Protein disulfide-isomerase-like protein EhSep2 [Durusdinium trenchii]|uniref:Protein disulfide-isomerase-like protein EhSep2 n=1 Tax=Durusdinium trenchii TaxID=1381693 RepID=A0ABP0RF79_9DINO